MTQLLPVSQHNSRCPPDAVDLLTQTSFLNNGCMSFVAIEQPGEMIHIQTCFVSKFQYNLALPDVTAFREERSADSKVKTMAGDLILLKGTPGALKSG